MLLLPIEDKLIPESGALYITSQCMVTLALGTTADSKYVFYNVGIITGVRPCVHPVSEKRCIAVPDYPDFKEDIKAMVHGVLSNLYNQNCLVITSNPVLNGADSALAMARLGSFRKEVQLVKDFVSYNSLPVLVSGTASAKTTRTASAKTTRTYTSSSVLCRPGGFYELVTRNDNAFPVVYLGKDNDNKYVWWLIPNDVDREMLFKMTGNDLLNILYLGQAHFITSDNTQGFRELTVTTKTDSPSRLVTMKIPPLSLNIAELRKTGVIV